MNSKSLVGVVLAITVLVSGAIGFFFRTSPAVNNPPVGSVVSLDGVDNQFVKINGVLMQYARQQFNNATSTYLCNIRNLTNATATPLTIATKISTTSVANANIPFGSFTYDVSTTSAPNGFGSSTPTLVFQHPVASGQSWDSMFWVPGVGTTTGVIRNFSSTTGETNIFLKPNESLSWRIATGSPGTYTSNALQGACSVILRAEQ